MHDLDLFSNDDIAEHGEKGKECRHCRLAVDNEKRDMVYFEAVCEVSHPRPAFVGMGDDNDLVAAVDEFLCTFYEIVFDQRGKADIATVDNWYMWLSTPPVDTDTIRSWTSN